jgi:hypothetical protein
MGGTGGIDEFFNEDAATPAGCGKVGIEDAGTPAGAGKTGRLRALMGDLLGLMTIGPVGSCIEAGRFCFVGVVGVLGLDVFKEEVGVFGLGIWEVGVFGLVTVELAVVGLEAVGVVAGVAGVVEDEEEEGGGG